MVSRNHLLLVHLKAVKLNSLQFSGCSVMRPSPLQTFIHFINRIIMSSFKFHNQINQTRLVMALMSNIFKVSALLTQVMAFLHFG